MGWATVETATNIFKGWSRNDSISAGIGQIVIELLDCPDFISERYDGAGGVRQATAQELADAIAAAQTVKEQREFDDQKMLKAIAIWNAQLHGLTNNQARQQILTIYRAL